MKPIHDAEISRNLKEILSHYPDITNTDVNISAARDQLIENLTSLIMRLPLNQQQGKKLYDAVTARYHHKTCYKCLKLKCVLNGTYTYPGGNLSGQKRFVCGECK